MYTCRSCLCKNCKCENCNCKNKRTLVMSKETFIIWAIGGAFKRDVCEKLCSKYQLNLLSLDALIDREKNDEGSKYKDDIKNRVGEDIIGISSNLLRDAIQDNNTAVGYIIESSTNYEILTHFEKAVGPIKVILFFKTSDKFLKNEFLEKLKIQDEISKIEQEKNENHENIEEENRSIKKCLKKTETMQEKALKKLNNFNENLEKVQKTYTNNFKVIKGRLDVEDSFFNNAVIFLDNLLNIPKEVENLVDVKKEKKAKK